MRTLICGSFAYDHIMVFGDRFKNHILPDKVHMLNVSFLVPTMRREFGGCAGNIAYNLKLLGGDPLPMGTVGEDFGPYAAWMDECGIDRTHVTVVEGTFTGQAFVTTDLDDNQITAFHPGAMGFSHRNEVGSAAGVGIGIVSPDGREGMIEHARQFAAAGIPFVFDPGQGLPMFDADDLLRFLDQATWLAANDYEWELIAERTGLTIAAALRQLEAVIVTRGKQGSVIHTRDESFDIPVVAVDEALDPTGCGDAYRAGLLYGLANGLDWPTTGRIASLLGAVKIAEDGTQNHRFSMADFRRRYREEFGGEF
ncbi:MAG: carbohydrate kinase family protein [Thermoleophilia bacterium]